MHRKICLWSGFVAISLISLLWNMLESQREFKPPVKIEIHKDIVNTMDIGIGWNFSGGLPGRWPEEWQHQKDYCFTDEDWDHFFDLMAWSGAHWLRHSILIQDWEFVNDNNNPDLTDLDSFSFQSEPMQQHYRVFDYAEKHGIKVMLTSWALGAQWLTDSKAENYAWMLEHPKDEEEFGEALAALVYYLKVEKQYSCIWGLSLWNEPNGHWAYAGKNSQYPETFWPLYGVVDKHLRRLNIRDDIVLIGPDTSTGGHPEHIFKMVKANKVIPDVLCDHDYEAFRGDQMSKSIQEYSRLMQNVNQYAGKRIPFIIGEFGGFQENGEIVNNEKKIYDGSLSLMTFMIEMLNHGASGLAQWEFLNYTDDYRCFGALSSKDKKYPFKPFAPVFYPHSICARYIRPGWKVLDVEVQDESQSMFCSVLSSESGEITIVLLNDMPRNRTVSIQIDPNIDVSTLNRFMLKEPVSDGIRDLNTVIIQNAKLAIRLPSKSITVLTTLPAGDLSFPEKITRPYQ